MAELVTTRYEYSFNTYNARFIRFARWYDTFRGWNSRQFQSYRNDVFIPLTLSTVLSDVARKVNISLGTVPYMAMVGGGPEDVAKARKNEALISEQMRDASILSKASDILLTSDLYGTAVAQVGWLSKYENILRRGEERTEKGRREKLVTQRTLMFDGPQFEPIDPLDFFPQPGHREIEDMMWVIRRYYLDLDEIEEMAKPISEGGPGVFDRDAVNRLKASNDMARGVGRDFVNRQFLVRNPLAEDENKRSEKYAKPIELLEMWGRVPSEFTSDGKGTQRVVTVANRRTVLRDSVNPFWHGRKPFLCARPVRDPHYFHGIGKVEIGEKLQYAVNRLTNKRLDALDLFIDPVMVYSRDADIDLRKLFMRPGMAIGANGDINAAIKTLSPDLSGLQNVPQEVENMWRWYQQGSGITQDTVMGQEGSSRTTAREFLARQESVSVRLLLESRLIEESFFEPMADMFRELNKQFLPIPRQVTMLGQDAIFDPITGMPLPPEQLEVGLDDLNMDYDVRARGATQTMTKSTRQQNLMTLLQALATNPAMMAMVNWQAFARDLFNTFEFANVNELLTPTPAQTSFLQAMAPGMAPGFGGTPPDAMSGTAALTPMAGEQQDATATGLSMLGV
jgi:hypothetical protein